MLPLPKTDMVVKSGRLGIRKGADKSLAFPVGSTTEIIFLAVRWVEEVRTTKS
jgi:hypothetical protein